LQERRLDYAKTIAVYGAKTTVRARYGTERAERIDALQNLFIIKGDQACAHGVLTAGKNKNEGEIT
jgi:hypothetical protein